MWRSGVPACIVHQHFKRMQLGGSDDDLLAEVRKHDRHVLLIKGYLIYLPIPIWVEAPHRHLILQTADVAINYLSQGTVYWRLLIHSIVTGRLCKPSFGVC